MLSLFVHCLAAAAGASKRALIKITPTDCIPITIVITIKAVKINSGILGEKPIDCENPGSNVDSFSSFHKSAMIIRTNASTIKMIITSCCVMVAEDKFVKTAFSGSR